MALSIKPELSKNIRFAKIFQRGFNYLQIFTFRLKFSLEDYKNKNIPWTLETFRWTFIFTPMTLAAIFCSGLLALKPKTHPFMKYHHIETILETNRMDLFVLDLFILSIILEAMFIQLSSEVLNYRSSFVKFIINNQNFNEARLPYQSLQFLRKFYCILYSIGTIGYGLYIINAIGTLGFGYYWAFIFLERNLTTIDEMILSVPAFAVMCTDLSYLVGQLFTTVLFFIVFVIELFQVKLKWLYKLSHKNFNNQCKKNRSKTIFWKNFQDKYVKLYAETADFNISFGKMLLYIEMVSKSSIIVSCMFYSNQKKISQYTITAILSLMSTFVCITSLYSRVARLPSYNGRCCKNIIKWLARTQWSPSKAKVNHPINERRIRNINRTTIKSNLFVQVMSQNQLGFTCGHLFFITKFKYNELVLMNIPLILMLILMLLSPYFSHLFNTSLIYWSLKCNKK
uniref:Uncharacterized protein LOC113794360 n=1 Tax=Dermatophagoides pteronyssinus TaxID=6956 RepID=A0A6P6Y4T0_DERPT|nr:uncharacterized protein LOC113794360 [Dermatophagoides pteronyssinus]